MLVLVAKPGLFTHMSQTTQQEQGTAANKPASRRDWEWFWRIVAGLMLLVIAWVVWVLYQITPRSVVTPLAYASQARPVGAAQAAMAAPAAPVQEAVAPPAPQPITEADRAMDAAQAAAQSGAHQASADVQAASLGAKQVQVIQPGLRLATELSAPPADNPKPVKTEAGRAPGIAVAPAATGAVRKVSP